MFLEGVCACLATWNAPSSFPVTRNAFPEPPRPSSRTTVYDCGLTDVALEPEVASEPEVACAPQ